MTGWQAFYAGWDPDDPDDGRVLCWYCQHWTHNLSLPVHYMNRAGQIEKSYRTVRCCEKGKGEVKQGFDPLIPRRCGLYKPRPPQYRVRLPDGSFPRGWEPLDGAPPSKANVDD